MALSSFTGLPEIPDNSDATPGLWNARYSIVSQNLDELNSELSNYSSTAYSNLSDQVFNVKDYGAVGDGSTNDSSAFQATAHAMTAGRTYMQTMLIPDGTYVINSDVTIGSYTRVLIRGAVKAADSATVNIFSANTQQHIEIEGGNFVGNSASAKATAVRGSNVSYFSVRGIYFSDVSGVVVNFPVASDTTNKHILVDNCTFEGGTTNGIFFSGEDAHITNNKFIGMRGATDEADIFVSQATNVIVANNVIENTSAQGIKSETSIYRITVADNVLHDVGAGGIVWGGATPVHDLTIAGNVLHSVGTSTGDAITGSVVQSKISEVERVTITGNSIHTSGGNGIVVQGKRCTVVGNTIHDVDTRGAGTKVGVWARGEDVIISSNNLQNDISAQAGIEVGSDITNCMIIGNRLGGGNYTSVISAAGSNVVIRQNSGYTTENSGLAEIFNGSTSTVVDHLLSVTPTLADIQVTPTDSKGTGAWISTPTSTQFTINVTADPGSNITFAWQAVAL